MAARGGGRRGGSIRRDSRGRFARGAARAVPVRQQGPAAGRAASAGNAKAHGVKLTGSERYAVGIKEGKGAHWDRQRAVYSSRPQPLSQRQARAAIPQQRERMKVAKVNEKAARYAYKAARVQRRSLYTQLSVSPTRHRVAKYQLRSAKASLRGAKMMRRSAVGNYRRTVAIAKGTARPGTVAYNHPMISSAV
jgi:hypothetical protein